METELVGPAEFTRRLLGSRHKAAVGLPLIPTPSGAGPSRMHWIADAVKRDALGWLVRQGGWRSRHVVVGGRRRAGRIWDKAIFTGLEFRFTSGPLQLLVAAMQTDATVPRLPKALRAAVCAGVRDADPATGDLLALHRIVSSIEGASAQDRRPRAKAASTCPSCQGATPDVRGKRPKACPTCTVELDPDGPDPGGERKHEAQRLLTLRTLSPLTLVFQIERLGTLEGDAATLAVHLGPLFAGDRAALLSYLDRTLASAWLREESRRRELPPRDALASYAAAVRGLQAYVVAAKGRPDALRPLIAFYVGYVVHRFGGRAPVYEALSKKSQGFDRASERQAFLRTAGALFSFGRVVTEAVDEALAAPFVDRSEEQKVLLADFHERFKDVAPEVEAIRRELEGEIG